MLRIVPLPQGQGREDCRNGEVLGVTVAVACIGVFQRRDRLGDRRGKTAKIQPS